MKRKRILVADDELGHRDLARYLLEPMGFEVVTVANGKEAVDAFANAPFDLVILDVHMPVMGGAEALRAIRSQRAEQKVVIVTGSPEMSDHPERIVGATACLLKPLSIDELTGLVAANLGA